MILVKDHLKVPSVVRMTTMKIVNIIKVGQKIFKPTSYGNDKNNFF